ncbi:MAG: hypothetical protein A3C14_03250 [Candidatus Lloydbacteria bacterium RIFCSPHIGHO2_02_FULL_50_18]|nr:MAG: hypothetical protein A3C14_03250 [Candidatus Lloydbacteria bacterium RIFCSPHIGHO2_02_FULL_50_18]
MNIGGAPSVVFAQIKYLDKEKFEPHLLMLYPSKEANFLKQLDFLPKEHIIQFKLCNRSIFDISTLRNIYRYLRRERFDVVYTHLFLANFLVRMLAIIARVPIILSFEHSTYFNKSSWQIIADRILAKWTDRIVVSTQEVADFTSTQEYLPGELFSVIRNPVTIPVQTLVDENELWDLTGFDRGGVLFLTIGRFSEEKGQHILLEAAMRVHVLNPKSKFLIVGHGPQEGILRGLVSKNNMDEYFRILHMPERAKEFLYIADWFVLPSLREGQSIVVEEAMLAGVPVITSALPGMGQVVTAGENGFLVETGNVESLQSALSCVLNEGLDRKNFSDKALLTAEKLLNTDDRMRRFESLLLSLYADKKRSAVNFSKTQ